jgi:histone arginine demethylase JMJD6
VLDTACLPLGDEMTDVSAAFAGADVAPDAYAQVDRVSGISMDEFVQRYRKARRPVVLTDALKDWAARDRYTPEFFCREYGDLPIRNGDRVYRLDEAIRLQQNATKERPGPYPCAITDCRALVDDITPRFAYALPQRHTHPLVPENIFNSVSHLDIFFGGPGNNFPFPHYDFLRMHGWVAQVYGDKEMTLYEPGQEHLLYVDPQKPWRSTMEYSSTPDYERYPLFRQARSHTVVVHAGEALFIPCGTWHTARCLNAGISVLFDQLEPSNWNEFVNEVVGLRRRSGQGAKALLIGAYLRVLGPVLSVAEYFGANRRADWGLH